MKKIKQLFLVCLISLFMISCDYVTINDNKDVLIIKSISLNSDYRVDNSNPKYDYTIQKKHTSTVLFFYSDEKYNVGDTLKFYKK